MFRSLWCKLGVTLNKTAVIINGESSSSSSLTPPAMYLLCTSFQNQNVVISNSRPTSIIFNSFSTTTTTTSNGKLTSPGSDSSFVVHYLMNSCGLSENQAITASKKISFKTTSKPDSVIALFKTYGFTESHISKLIPKRPSILSSEPDKTLKPRFDFFISKGFCEIELADFISSDPTILWRSLNNVIIPSFDILKSIVLSDENVVKMLKRSSWILGAKQVARVMVNVEHLRNEGVPETNISKYLIKRPRIFTGDADSFKGIVEKVKEMGFNHLQTAFLNAMRALTSMTEANWRKKMDVYKRWGWSEDQIHTAFRKDPNCMTVSEKKIMAIMTFLVIEMGYDSLCIAEIPRVIYCSLKERIIPRCSVIRVLVSKGLMKEHISLTTLATMVDESFLGKFVKKYEQQVPGLMQVFEGQLNYHELLQN